MVDTNKTLSFVKLDHVFTSLSKVSRLLAVLMSYPTSSLRFFSFKSESSEKRAGFLFALTGLGAGLDATTGRGLGLIVALLKLRLDLGGVSIRVLDRVSG